MWKSVIEMMAYQGEHYPDLIFTRYLDGDSHADVYTYSATWQLILRWADLLAEQGVTHGSTVILALPNSADFIGAYFGVLLVGGIPAAVPPIKKQTTNDNYANVLAMRIRFIDAKVCVVPLESAAAIMQLGLDKIDGLKILSRGDLPDIGRARTPGAASDDLGLLQFTSATSGSAKVVQLTHAALLAQTQMISEALRLDPSVDSAVSWLPLYHDMGLIGYLLTPASNHGTVNLMQTDDFIARPGLWIKALSDYGATLTGGPPSAYLQVARRMKASEIVQYRLDHVRVALVGAETVTEASVNPFLEKFSPIGFRHTSLMPSYGMAENGLAVTLAPLDCLPVFDYIDSEILHREKRAVPPVDDRPGRTVASVGVALQGIEIAIVDNLGSRLEDRHVGEIIVCSPSLMRGYFRLPELTNEAIRDNWLHTGDLGYLADGQLFITGRKKEILIVGGRNYYPEELEEVAGKIPGVRMRHVVAVSHANPETGTEAVILFVETSLTERAERDNLRLNVRKALTTTGFPVSDVVLLRPKTIQFTYNGKLMRGNCLSRYFAGEFADTDE